jgi:hypothetical protein
MEVFRARKPERYGVIDIFVILIGVYSFYQKRQLYRFCWEFFDQIPYFGPNQLFSVSLEPTRAVAISTAWCGGCGLETLLFPTVIPSSTAPSPPHTPSSDQIHTHDLQIQPPHLAMWPRCGSIGVGAAGAKVEAPAVVAPPPTSKT